MYLLGLFVYKTLTVTSVQVHRLGMDKFAGV